MAAAEDGDFFPAFEVALFRFGFFRAFGVLELEEGDGEPMEEEEMFRLPLADWKVRERE